jgi:hypothetical protein
MRLFEIEAKILYFATEREYQLGQIVGPERIRSRWGAKIEGVLEQNRPSNLLPRLRSVLLWYRAPRGAKYVYATKPIGRLERGHTGWLAAMQAQDAEWPQLNEWAVSYWMGAEAVAMSGWWEYRAPQVEIVKRVNEPIIKR